MIKLSDSFSCDLNSFSIEKCAGWEDAEINELTDHQRVSISEKFYGIKDGQMGDFKITLEISTGSHNNEDVAFCRNIIIGEKEYTIMIAVLEA